MRYFTIFGGCVEVLGIVITGWGLFYAWRRLGIRIRRRYGRARPIDQAVYGTDQVTVTEDQMVLKKFQLNTDEPVAVQVDSLYKQIADIHDDMNRLKQKSFCLPPGVSVDAVDDRIGEAVDAFGAQSKKDAFKDLGYAMGGLALTAVGALLTLISAIAYLPPQ